MLVRRALYRPSKAGVNLPRGSKTRIQLALLDVATGQLKKNHLLKASVGNDPRCQIVCRPGKEYQSDQDDEVDQAADSEDDAQNQRLELMIASQSFIWYSISSR